MSLTGAALRRSPGWPSPCRRRVGLRSRSRPHQSRLRISSPPTSTPSRTQGRARKLVERFSLYSGVAGLLPVPVVDIAAVGGVQLQMLRRISQIYDVPFSKNRGKAIMASFAGTMIPASTGLGVASMVKERARRRNGNRRDDHAGAVRWRHLRDRHDFRRALCLGRDAA